MDIAAAIQMIIGVAIEIRGAYSSMKDNIKTINAMLDRIENGLVPTLKHLSMRVQEFPPNSTAAKSMLSNLIALNQEFVQIKKRIESYKKKTKLGRVFHAEDFAKAMARHHTALSGMVLDLNLASTTENAESLEKHLEASFADVSEALRQFNSNQAAVVEEHRREVEDLKMLLMVQHQANQIQADQFEKFVKKLEQDRASENALSDLKQFATTLQTVRGDSSGAGVGAKQPVARQSTTELAVAAATINPSEVLVGTKQLGSGGFSVVRDGEYNGTRVALKIFAVNDRTLSLSERDAKVLRREVATMFPLRHPNICRCDGVVVSDTLNCLVLELLDGVGNLYDKMGSLSWDERVSLSCEISSAIAYLHTKAIVHNDIKSSNVMVVRLFTSSGERKVAKIIDFGLAVSKNAMSQYSVKGSLRGTPMWMAPERLSGDELQGNFASDVWSLGMLLVEMVSLEPMFGVGVDAQSAVLAIRNFKLPKIRPSNDAEPESAEAFLQVVERCLAFDPKQRITAAEANKLLCQIAEKLEERRQRQNPPAPLPPSPPVTLPVVVVEETEPEKVTSCDMKKGDDATPDPPLAPFTPVAIKDMSEIQTKKRDVKHCSVSSSGTLIAISGCDGLVSIWTCAGVNLFTAPRVTGKTVFQVAFGANDSLLASAEEGGSVTLWNLPPKLHASERGPITIDDVYKFDAHQKSCLCVCFLRSSSNDLRFATGGNDKLAKVWDATTRTCVATLQGHTFPVSCIAAGKGIIATASWDKKALIWDATSCVLLHTLVGHLGSINSIAVSTDGRRVVTGSADTTMKLWCARTGSELRTFQESSSLISVDISNDGSMVAAGSQDGVVSVSQLGRRRPIIFSHQEHQEAAVCCVRFVNGDAAIMSCCSEGKILSRDIGTPSPAILKKTELPSNSSCEHSLSSLHDSPPSERKPGQLYKRTVVDSQQRQQSPVVMDKVTPTRPATQNKKPASNVRRSVKLVKYDDDDDEGDSCSDSEEDSDTRDEKKWCFRFCALM